MDLVPVGLFGLSADHIPHDLSAGRRLTECVSSAPSHVVRGPVLESSSRTPVRVRRRMPATGRGCLPLRD